MLLARNLVGHTLLSDQNISSNRFLHKDDSVDGYCAPLAEAPCFLPIVPRTTSCKPDLFQQIEYPQVIVFKADSECWNSFGGIGAVQNNGCKSTGSPLRESLAHSKMAVLDHILLFSLVPSVYNFWHYEGTIQLL